MSGLLRTTSRSESENSFFNHFVNNKLGMVEFYSRFYSAMESQRQKELKADHETLYGKPKLKTGLPLELHASLIYTQNFFYMFQDELWSSCMSCGVKSSMAYNDNGDLSASLFNIIDSSKETTISRDVVISASSIYCTCKMYESQGIPCRHIILVLKGQELNELPPYCVLRRWTRMSISHSINLNPNKFYDDASSSEQRQRLISNAWECLTRCMEVAKDSDEVLIELAINASNWEKKMHLYGNNVMMAHNANVEYGSNMTTQIEILPPIHSKTKGSGKRIKSGIELGLEKKQKNVRLCRMCGKHGLHDRRNCPQKNVQHG